MAEWSSLSLLAVVRALSPLVGVVDLHIALALKLRSSIPFVRQIQAVRCGSSPFDVAKNHFGFGILTVHQFKGFKVPRNYHIYNCCGSRCSTPCWLAHTHTCMHTHKNISIAKFVEPNGSVPNRDTRLSTFKPNEMRHTFRPSDKLYSHQAIKPDYIRSENHNLHWSASIGI